MRVGAVLGVTLAAVLSAALPSSAGAAVTIGSSLATISDLGTFTNRTYAPFAIPGRLTTAPFNGVVVRWRLRDPSGSGMLTPRVLHPLPGGSYLGEASGTPGAVSNSPPPDIPFEHSTRLPIHAGDLVGLDIPPGGPGGMFDSSPATTTTRVWNPPLPAGGTAMGTVSPGMEFLMNADIEPDCDGDGFGDESQDPDISSCGPAPPPAEEPAAGPGPTPPVLCQGLPPTVTGSEGPDSLTGTKKQDVIAGLGGNDQIKARKGHDVLCGGDGDDSLKGAKGRDALDGGNGTDACNGGKGRDTGASCESEKKIP